MGTIGRKSERGDRTVSGTNTADPRCPECGEPIGSTAAYCMHCSADPTEERERADTNDDGVWDAFDRYGSADAADGSSSTAATSAATDTAEGDGGLLDPEGFVDDTLTVVVGLGGGFVVGFHRNSGSGNRDREPLSVSGRDSRMAPRNRISRPAAHRSGGHRQGCLRSRARAGIHSAGRVQPRRWGRPRRADHGVRRTVVDRRHPDWNRRWRRLSRLSVRSRNRDRAMTSSAGSSRASMKCRSVSAFSSLLPTSVIATPEIFTTRTLTGEE